MTSANVAADALRDALRAAGLGCEVTERAPKSTDPASPAWRASPLWLDVRVGAACLAVHPRRWVAYVELTPLPGPSGSPAAVAGSIADAVRTGLLGRGWVAAESSR